MDIIGITGTNGKTTTTYLVQHILNECGRNCGLIGTTGIRIGDKFVESARTTPESVELQKIFADMRKSGCDSVVMEVSSHALVLYRTYSTHFDVTAFTNLTQDHLDYHHTFEEYFAAKQMLFDDGLYPAKRVLNTGNDYGEALYDFCAEHNDDILTYSFFEHSDIHPMEVSYGNDHTSATMKINGTTHHIEYPLVGRFNLENVMCAIGICVSLGCDVKDVIRALKSGIKVPGRLEHVSVEVGDDMNGDERDLPSVYVDYAHTPDAVSKAGGAVNALKEDPTHAKSIIVIGCGGDRDATKRPLMGQAALARCDYAIITSDNPRTENPDAIIEDIVAGLRDKKYAGKFEVVPDRREAIRKAINMGCAGDVVLIAGKGHEDYQIVGEEKHHFDDREETIKALEAKSGIAS